LKLRSFTLIIGLIITMYNNNNKQLEIIGNDYLLRPKTEKINLSDQNPSNPKLLLKLNIQFPESH
jgi:hypothetical protein